MCNYYRKFIKDYSKICAPLLNLLKKNIRFQWKPEHTDAFNILKRKLTTAPILAFPDFGKPFVLSIDASDTAVGYVLGQINSQGLENVIAFGGRALRDQEKRWHINHKEGLALIEAIKTFKAYLTSAEFTVFTDNITVRWLESTKDATGRLGRWALFLQQYKFKIQHRPGTRNQNADCLAEIIHLHPQSYTLMMTYQLLDPFRQTAKNSLLQHLSTFTTLHQESLISWP